MQRGPRPVIRGSAALVAAALAVPGLVAAQTKPPAPVAGTARIGAAVTVSAPKYVAVGFADLPGWRGDDHAAAFQAFLQGCPMVIAAARAGNKAGAVRTPPELLAVCDEALRLAPRGITEPLARAFFEGYFVPHRVEHAGPPGLLTGYYEPLIEGSRVPTARFRTPVHRRPTDLVNLVDESQRGAKADVMTHGRKTDKGIVPYATRAEIEQGALAGKGLELLYLADPVEKFFMQVQGSGRVKLPDGSMLRVSYDGKNGHPYTSVGRYLIDSGLFAADKMSLAALGAWLRADPERGRKAMWQNKSYVFFRELAGVEARGALGVLHIPLTPGRSLAVDAGVHVIGLPVYVSSAAMTHTGRGGFHRLMVAQDVGSAIRGPERGDIYFGTGDAAGKLAGVTKHPGQLFVLLPRGAGAAIAKTTDGEVKSGSAGDITTGSLSQRADP